MPTPTAVSVRKIYYTCRDWKVAGLKGLEEEAGQYDDNECTLPMCVHRDASKHGRNHLRAVSKTWIHLEKKSLLAISVPSPMCDAASRVAAAMLSKLKVHVSA
ncbi:hypothetical protein TNCV_1820891 [Trichonephila clavipes]|nr:hypothetical protein TNCV_1820891 [Trichonephila clavipes]